MVKFHATPMIGERVATQPNIDTVVQLPNSIGGRSLNSLLAALSSPIPWMTRRWERCSRLISSLPPEPRRSLRC